MARCGVSCHLATLSFAVLRLRTVICGRSTAKGSPLRSRTRATRAQETRAQATAKPRVRAVRASCGRVTRIVVVVQLDELRAVGDAVLAEQVLQLLPREPLGLLDTLGALARAAAGCGALGLARGALAHRVDGRLHRARDDEAVDGRRPRLRHAVHAADGLRLHRRVEQLEEAHVRARREGYGMRQRRPFGGAGGGELALSLIHI
eukprot:829539-Prymnesium_polylepis.1